MINKFITDKTKIYLVYKVDDHIYGEREIERYNICTLAENITFICTSLRNRQKSGPLIKIIELFTAISYKLDLASENPIMGGSIFFSRDIRTIAKFKRQSRQFLYICCIYFEILGQKDGVRNQMTPPSTHTHTHTHTLDPPMPITLRKYIICR